MRTNARGNNRASMERGATMSRSYSDADGVAMGGTATKCMEGAASDIVVPAHAPWSASGPLTGRAA
jgi:hypothetical protein